jgi:hypothetical protein
MKHFEQMLATCFWNTCNICNMCNIPRSTFVIQDETIATYIWNVWNTRNMCMQNRGGKRLGAATEKLGFEQHHGNHDESASGSGSRNMPGDSREWQTPLCGAPPCRGHWSPSVPDGHRLLLLLTRRRRRRRGRHTVLPSDQAAARTARWGQAKRSSWREGDVAEVERGKQTDGLARGRFGEFPDSAPVCACWFFERERTSGWGQHYRYGKPNYSLHEAAKESTTPHELCPSLICNRLVRPSTREL